MGVQGFPTLKIVRPSKKAGRPTVEDYQGARSAKAIVDAVVDKIPNHVRRVTDKDLDEWMRDSNGTAKAVLFSDKGTTSALLRALAIDFLGSINFAQIRDKEKKAVSLFGVSSYPTLILLPGGSAEGVVYSGEMKKDALTSFLSQAAPPNPDPALQKPKAAKKPSSPPNQKKASKDSSSFSAASASHASSEAAASGAAATSITLDASSPPTASPDPNVVSADTPQPVPLPAPAALPSLSAVADLQRACLAPKSGTCILLLASSSASGASSAASASLSEIVQKHRKRQSHLFPFYALPGANTGAAALRAALALGGEVELVATNAKRGWWRRYDGAGRGFGRDAVEAWIDEIRMGEGRKERLPEALVSEAEAAGGGEGEAGKGEEQTPVQIEVEEISDDGGHDEL